MQDAKLTDTVSVEAIIAHELVPTELRLLAAAIFLHEATRAANTLLGVEKNLLAIVQ